MTGPRVALVMTLVVLAGSALASSHIPIHINLKLDGAPAVGEECAVVATATADYDLPDVTVEIVLPTDGAIAGPSKLIVPKAKASESMDLQTRIAFSKPGIKSVKAIVRSTERPGVVWSAVAYATLEVGEKSGSVLTDVRAIRTPPLQQSKGSGRILGRPAADKASGEPIQSEPVPESAMSSEEPPAPSESDLVISGKWSFTNRAGNPVGMRYHLVQLIKTLPTEMVIATTHTDANGNFTFPAVSYTSVGLYVRASTAASVTNGSAYVVVLPGQYYSADTNVVSYAHGGPQSAGEWIVTAANPQYKAWWVSDDMIKACLVPPDSIGAHTAWFDCVNNGGAYYTPGGKMYIFANDVDDTPDTVLHEMGHSVMYNIYGDYMPDNPNCHPHYLFGDSSTGCAWTEGWAQTWHMWTTNDPVRNYPGGGAVDLEAATWGDGGDEGSDVEGRVAGALWDIADSVDDGYDHFSNGWLNIWYIMYHHNCDKFSEFWSQWKALGYPTHGVVAAIYQNTIDWNTAPTFNQLPNVTLVEDEFRANVMDLDDYASDPESQDYQLQFTIGANPGSNLQMGIDYDHRLNMQGNPNWFGTENVLITCSDGITTTTSTFTITVTAVNDPPVIQGLPDTSLNEDGSLLNWIDLTHYTTDPETSSTLLTYSIAGNTNPNCGVSLVSGRYVSIQPVANWFGVSDVTIRATDSKGLYDEDVFRITVNSVNDPPVLSGLPDRTLNEDATLDNTIDLWAYASDIEIPSSALTYVVSASGMPAGSVTIDSNRYVDITPAANLYGQFNVTIQAWDFESGYGEDTFSVTINPLPDPPVFADVPDQLYQTPKTSQAHLIDLRRYASDPDGPVTDLTFSIHRNTNTSIGATIESNRYLRITHAAFYSGYTEITVRATDPTSNSVLEVVNVVVGRECETCFEACNVSDDGWVIFPSKTVTVSHAYAFYMQDALQTSGIRVASEINPDEGRYVTVGGQMTTYNGERAVDCKAFVLGGINTNAPRPLYMTNKSLGGAHPSAYTPPVPTAGAGKLYNVGLLVRTAGKVVSRNSNSFWIDDGSRVPYSFSTRGLYVDCQPIAMYAPTLGSRVAVTGASGACMVGDNVVNTLRLRSRLDVEGLGGRVVYFYYLNLSAATGYADVLGDCGWSTDIVSTTSLLSTDLSGYDIVVLGADTGSWTDSSKVAHIVDSDKPVIAMGAGGARFLDQVSGLYVGYGNSATASLSQGYVNDLSSVIYWWDSIIPVPTNNLLDMFTTGVNTTLLGSPPTGVYGLLRHPTNSQYWAVAQEGRFMQWGYDAHPSICTEAAKKLLVNSLYYMQGK